MKPENTPLEKGEASTKPAILGFQPSVFRYASTFSIRFELRSSMKNVYGLLQIAAWGNKNWGRILGKYSGKFTTHSFLRPDSALVTVVSVAFDCVHMCPIKYIFKYIINQRNHILSGIWNGFKTSLSNLPVKQTASCLQKDVQLRKAAFRGETRHISRDQFYGWDGFNKHVLENGTVELI